MEQTPVPNKIDSFKLPVFMTTVTPFSKLLAAILFIILPLFGFYLGIRYQKTITSESPTSPASQTGPLVSPSIPANLPAVTSADCHENDSYFLVVDNQTGNFLIKSKNAGQKYDCKYIKNTNDYEIQNAGADWYLGLKNNFLFIDSGTGPPPRGITIYDLAKRRLTFTGTYNNPVDITDNHFDYWKGTDIQVTKANCPDKDSWENGGLETAIEEHVRLNLTSLKESSLNETRCSPRQ